MKKEKKQKEEIMTDKEQIIIIDGVDVSGCDYHYIDNDGMHRCFKDDQTCNCDANCSFGALCLKEELQRKTQECEAYKMESEEGREINSELKAESSRYRKALDEIEDIIKESDCINCREHYYNQHCEDCDKGEILYIISKAKGEE